MSAIKAVIVRPSGRSKYLCRPILSVCLSVYVPRRLFICVCVCVCVCVYVYVCVLPFSLFLVAFSRIITYVTGTAQGRTAWLGGYRSGTNMYSTNGTLLTDPPLTLGTSYTFYSTPGNECLAIQAPPTGILDLVRQQKVKEIMWYMYYISVCVCLCLCVCVCVCVCVLGYFFVVI
jgi:hypothetical protein